MDHALFSFHYRNTRGPAGRSQRQGVLLRAWQALLAAWHYAKARREFDRLDAQTLRDLGLGPSEFGSYWAEAQGLAERTRSRVRTESEDRA